MPETIFLNPHPATLADEDLLKQCEVAFGRTSGPGGQHRNKVETAATLTHLPSGISATGTERRRQIENRGVALKRLRLKLALRVRANVSPKYYTPTELWESRRQGKQLSINPLHRDYPALLAEALDVIVARKFDVAGAAGILGISMSQLAKLVRHDKHAFAMVNEGRVQRGLPALK
ncbi:MAG TPA: peptide chain release factor-like protein [Phycisphaerales bacterium]|nr:peptide chain release factor-like protein [Phycisphaerales bacterium]HRQ74643.1 peptide chain release factor-like protein [Phycisphaerales bacterium]